MNICASELCGINMTSRSVSCEDVMMDKLGETFKFTMGRKMPSQSSIASSLSSLYEKYNIHINILKWTGVVVLLAMMSTSLAITSNMTRNSFQNSSDCIKITTTSDDRRFNDTLCKYIKTFDLPEQYKLSVCSYQQQVRIDIRYFIGDKATIRGIHLNKLQWAYLQRLTPHINSAVKRADNVLYLD